MKHCIIMLSLMVVASAQRSSPDYLDQPIPYSFNYVAPDEEGSSSRQETGDGNGRVRGSYELSDIDGRYRVVEYTADENGFRANIRTNEPGTANQNPADVTIESAADQGGIAAPAPQIRTQPPRLHPPAIRTTAYQPGLAVGSRSPTPGYVLIPIDDLRRLN